MMTSLLKTYLWVLFHLNSLGGGGESDFPACLLQYDYLCMSLCV